MEQFRKEEKGVALLESTELALSIKITKGYKQPYQLFEEDIVQYLEIEESVMYVRDFGDNDLRAAYVDITDLILQFWTSKKK